MADYDLDEEDIEQAKANGSRAKVVMNGWRDRWAPTEGKFSNLYAAISPTYPVVVAMKDN